MIFSYKQKPFHECGTSEDIVRQLSSWFNTPLGHKVAMVEKTMLDGILPTLFGYHLVQIGQYSDVSLLQSSKVSQCCIMHPSSISEPESTCDSRLCGDTQSLPFASDSIDVVILNHVLEFSLHPHQVLREVERVLVPEGHLVMMMFNPWSLWSLNRLLFRWRKTAPWCGKFIGSTRSKDWLALLGFEVTQSRGYFFRPAIQQMTIMDRLTGLEKLGNRYWPGLGGCYMLTAKKKTETMTPIKPKWTTRRRRVVASGLVESMESWRKKAS